MFNDFESAQNALLVLNPLDRDTVKNAECDNRWHAVPAEVSKRMGRNQRETSCEAPWPRSAVTTMGRTGLRNCLSQQPQSGQCASPREEECWPARSQQLERRGETQAAERMQQRTDDEWEHHHL